MKLSELWHLYEADKRIQGFSPRILNAYDLQNKMLMTELGDPEIAEITLPMLKQYLAKQAERLKPSSLGHRIRFVRSLFRYAYEQTYLTSNPSLILRERALPELLYCTGCRVGEIERINSPYASPKLKNL